jgi:hypothetical protein
VWGCITTQWSKRQKYRIDNGYNTP